MILVGYQAEFDSHRLKLPIDLYPAPILVSLPAGARTVIHPKAKIFADAGPIIIGENNLIEEQAHIINK